MQRLAAISTSLEERIAEARERGWAGEVQQLRVSLEAARDKLAASQRNEGPLLLPTPTRLGVMRVDPARLDG